MQFLSVALLSALVGLVVAAPAPAPAEIVRFSWIVTIVNLTMLYAIGGT